jgi:hypothetical protein
VAERSPISYVDPGWLYMLGGIGLLAATVLIPAIDELAEVQLQRDRAVAIERHQQRRVDNYGGYLEALKREEPSLVMALAASQLNQIPASRSLVLETPEGMGGAKATAAIFAALEPGELGLPEREQPRSLLHRWATAEGSRTWLIAAGGVCLLMGALPRSRVSGGASGVGA